MELLDAGFVLAAQVTVKGPLGALGEHLSDPISECQSPGPCPPCSAGLFRLQYSCIVCCSADRVLQYLLYTGVFLWHALLFDFTALRKL